MESNNSFIPDMKRTIVEPKSATNQELNESELDAIAGGCSSVTSDTSDKTTASGLRIINAANSPGLDFDPYGITGLFRKIA
ncbi:hypothetical protein [Floridanema aerugineum]|uniref:Uncharacterized protein n=1 Tax=Floridaenema aerugineum BLCC-F46 TaxID=3153654 RepID=A0ABV4X1Z0_9CYAN